MVIGQKMGSEGQKSKTRNPCALVGAHRDFLEVHFQNGVSLLLTIPYLSMVRV